VACYEALMWYETSDNYEEFHKFLQVATIDAGLQIVIAEYLHIDIRHSVKYLIFELYHIHKYAIIQASLNNQIMATKVTCINKNIFVIESKRER